MANPAILTVDDDPAVSRAVARDIRRQYGDRYRVVRANSGAEGLDALRELKLRGDPVALLLADYRMPQMNGIEFLEAAMDLFPLARRVLLTAYADTDAAIDAINVVDLDHYLLKPWHPPEEKLYPVVDQLLEAWLATPEVAPVEIRIVGHRWSAPSFAARDFLARNLVPYRWLLADEPEGQRLLTAAGVTAADVPLVVTADGKSLVMPTEARAGRPRGHVDHAGVGLLRPHRGRRRAGRVWGPRSTAPPRGCARCWSSGRRPAGRPGRAAGSRTTSASPTACRAPS